MISRQATFLIIDDDPNDLLFIEEAFKILLVSSRIQTATGGREAIRYLLGEGKYADRKSFGYPDIIITDLKMPAVDGFDVLNHIRQHPSSAAIPTIILSGSQNEEDVRRAYMLGASAYHIKPNGPSELRRLVKALHEYWLLCKLAKPTDLKQQVESGNVYNLGGPVLQSAAPWFKRGATVAEEGKEIASHT